MPEVHVDATAGLPTPGTLAAVQKSHCWHLHMEQCEDANWESQKGSHILYDESSGTFDEQGGPALQKPHALHLHR